MTPSPARWFAGMPASTLNGVGVALGIAVIQALIAPLAGAQAAQLALSGALCTSLSDAPGTPARTVRRTALAALLSVVAAFVVAGFKSHSVWMGLGVGLVAFTAMLAMAWGARAAAVAFAPVLSMVFSLAVPAAVAPPLTVALWSACGSAAYVAWSCLAAWGLQRRYRRLALASVLDATAALMITRARRLDAGVAPAPQVEGWRSWLRGEAQVAEQLQAARDLVFTAENRPQTRRATTILLRIIDLRERLFLSDRGTTGRVAPVASAAGDGVLARSLAASAQRLSAAAQAVRQGAPMRDEAETPGGPTPPAMGRASLPPVADASGHAPGEHALIVDIAADVDRIEALVRGAPANPELDAEQLRRFVSPEGFALAALRGQLSPTSPVMRHAVRTGLALGTAYVVGLALPWASHPHWLVLSVAVVLRGSLEQTLSRRDARTLGTGFGCLLVLGLAAIDSPALLAGVFFFAVAIAHANVNQRYWLTATAATVMALLQAHKVDPASGYAIAERAADTVLGALMAWAFSYVLPSWERRHLPAAIGRTLDRLREYAAQALRAQDANGLEQRLARRQAYEALRDLSAALQRGAAEPASVRLPTDDVAALVDHTERLLAHLSAARLMFAALPAAQASDPWVAAALRHTCRSTAHTLSLEVEPGTTAAQRPPPREEGPGAGIAERVIDPGITLRLAAVEAEAASVRRAAARLLARPRA